MRPRRAPAIAALILLGASACAPAGDYLARGITPGSAWSEILGARHLIVRFPFAGFGGVFAPLSMTCADGDRLSLLPAPGARRPPAAPAVPLVRRDALLTVWARSEIPRDAEGKAVLLFVKPWSIPACVP